MEKACQMAVDLALKVGATYADARVVQRRIESVVVKNGKVEALESLCSSGIGLRVIAHGCWGFASSAMTHDAEIKRIAQEAVDLARASAMVSAEPVRLADAEPVRDEWRGPCQKDPFDVPITQKIDLLMEADARARRRSEVRVCEGAMRFFRELTHFANSEGSDILQERTESGASVEATAVGDGEVQKRSYPSSLEGFHAAGGWEIIEALDLPSGAEKMGQQAADLLTAPPCPSGIFPVILDASQVALQIHESCGHPIELDRVFGSEASYAGTSFLTPDKLGEFRYGSDIVNITADSTLPGGLGTFGYDDEGVPASKTQIVKNGIFTGYLMSRETALRLGMKSNGAMRADGWNRIPLIRMTNINLEPGDCTLEQMIKGIDHGFMLETTRSWSIDDVRLNFHFATQIGWEIKNGSITRMVRNPTYQGVTPEFWATCDAIGNRDCWRLWGVTNCGKGEPMQSMRVGHGAAPARFSAVQVGAPEE